MMVIPRSTITRGRHGETKELIYSVYTGNRENANIFRMLGGNINCNIESFIKYDARLLRIVLSYTVGGMSDRMRPYSLLAASTAHKRSYMTRMFIKYRTPSELAPIMRGEDMLWVSEHSKDKNFMLLCYYYIQKWI